MASALSNARILLGDRVPIKCVNADFGMLTSWSQKMLLACLRPSSTPIWTCVESPSKEEKTGAQIAVRKPGVNKGLTADNREHAEVPRVVARSPVNPVEFAAYHRSTW